ncbi:MAG: InlB B-repeat-containing protein, partial [Acholeplasmataceae bacterium]
MKKLLSFFLFILLIAGLFGCQDKPEDPIDPIEPTLTEYSIVFQSVGGTLVDPIKVIENETATKPENPTRSQAVFRYWYAEDQDIPFDFSKPITQDVTLRALWSEPDVEIGQSKTVNFDNLTTEFDVEDGTLDLFFPVNGNIPYVKVSDYFELLKGFIDPEVEFTITQTEDKLTIYYEYYDEDEDEIYELECVFDVEKNLITTNDPGFYWAYIYSTETNYG